MDKTPSYVIEMLHITKEFPGIKANDDITLQLKKGEIHALLGENGAGKSTLMSVLFGLYQPEAGEIRKNGQTVKINDPNDATALGIGMVHQHFKLVEVFSVLDNIILGAETTKCGFLQKKEARRKVEELSKRYGLHVDLDAKVVDGKRKPSSEWALHTTFYKHKPHARAVVHTHSVYCTTLAVLGEPIRAVHYVIGDAGAAEVPCAPYQLFGTEALAEAAMEVCGKSDGVLLGNHGLVCCGKDIKGAYGLACNLEYIAEIQCRAMSIGKPNVLTEEQMAEVMVKFQSYGQPGAKKTGY